MQLKTPKDVGQLVRDRRKRLGLSQAELAERVGVTRQWVAALEAGKASVEVGLVLATLRALEIHVQAVPREGIVRHGIDLKRILRETAEEQP